MYPLDVMHCYNHHEIFRTSVLASQGLYHADIHIEGWVRAPRFDGNQAILWRGGKAQGKT